jgi:hypothetical protein
MERMTSQESFGGKPSAFEGAEFTQRLHGVLRTRGMESARRREDQPQGVPIQPDSQYQDAADNFLRERQDFPKLVLARTVGASCSEFRLFHAGFPLINGYN